MRAVVALLVLAGCSKQAHEGLPPATEWSSNDPADQTLGGPTMPSRPRGTPNADPHAGIAGAPPISGGGNADPHAGIAGAPPIMGGGGGNPDPHAGVPGAPPLDPSDMPGVPGSPHGGAGTVGGGVDVTQLGLASPDPNRPIDPSRHVRGTIKLSPAVKARVAAGATLFLMVRKPDANGQPLGTLISVDRVLWSADGQSFELTEKHAMIAGAPDLVGELMVAARVDQDADAGTKQPGDVTGFAKVKIPATGVVLELDTILP